MVEIQRVIVPTGADKLNKSCHQFCGLFSAL